MSDPSPDLAPADAFPPATREIWLGLVERALKGASFERLVSRTADGLRIEPLYAAAEPAPQPGRARHGRWRIAQRVDHPEDAAANELALADLRGGADALSLVFAEAPSARGFGLRTRSVDDLDRALRDVLLDLVQLRVEAGGRGRQAAALVLDLAERRGLPPASLDLDLGLDPIGALAATGRMSAPWEVVGARAAEILGNLAARGLRGAAFRADGRPYHEAGASEAQELAAVLATAVATLRALEAGGHELDRARDALSFLLVADADEFGTIAKFRAFRRLWARVEVACGLEPRPARLHAETAWRMTTRRDPHVNLLRGTLAAFSAGVGGADGITVLPFTAALGLPDAFARRLARNAQLILMEEASLWRVADPAAGAGAFETLTKVLAEQAWAAFQAIEREGGIVESLGAGVLQGRIATARAARERRIALRRDPITGTSEYPNLSEAPVAVLISSPPTGAGPRPPALPDPSLDADRGDGAGMSVEPLPSRRDAEGFERLRDRSDALLARTGRRPSVFLANLGPVSAFTARATFATSFFEAGGIEAPTNEGFPDRDALLAAFRAARTAIACLCSSDEIYAAEGSAVADALAAAGAERVFLAGRPSEGREHGGRGGVVFVHTGCDALAILAEAQDAAAGHAAADDES